MQTRQGVDENTAQQIRAQNIKAALAIQEVQGVEYYIRTQKVEIKFLNIENSREMVEKMPLVSKILLFDSITKEFNTSEAYKNYEITKTY